MTRGADSPPFLWHTLAMTDTPILILAAGQSRRMRGTDKLAELVRGEPLLTRVARTALAASSRVFVALPAADHPRAGLLAGLAVTSLAVPQATEGQAATLRMGVAALPDCPRFMVLLADLPDLTAGDLTAVLTAPLTAPDALIWRGATDDGKPGHPILFAASLRPRFATLSGDSGGQEVTVPLSAQTHLVRLPGNRARHDLDTPEDWAAYRSGQ